jgi:hypothetical protein
MVLMRIFCLISLLVLSIFIGTARADDLLTAVLPSSRSAVEGQPVTVFATVINTSGKDLQFCDISTEDHLNTSVTFATTDPLTNQVLNATPYFNVAAGASQSLVLTLVSADVVAGQVEPVVTCRDSTKTYSSIPVVGLNTILFSSSVQPVPDVIALVASPSNDGVLRIQGNGANAFAVAVSNVGVSDTISAKVDTGDITLPIAVSLCQTDAHGQCLQPAAAGATVSLAANATTSYSVFVQATGQIPFYPAGARIFVRFYDSSGQVRGATSVAVTNVPSLDAALPKGGLFTAVYPIQDGSTNSNAGALFLTEDGEMQGADSLGNVISGSLSVGPGLTLTGTSLYTPAGNLVNEWQGVLAQRSWFSAEVVIPSSTLGFQFGGTYIALGYERGSSLATVAGAWHIRDDTGALLATVNVASDGRFSSSGSSCAVSGQIALIDSRYNLYRMTLNYQGCSVAPTGATNFTGLMALDDDRSANDTLLFIGNNATQYAGTILPLVRY